MQFSVIPRYLHCECRQGLDLLRYHLFVEGDTRGDTADKGQSCRDDVGPKMNENNVVSHRENFTVRKPAIHERNPSIHV